MSRKLNIAQHLRQQSRPKRFTGMDRNNRCPSIGMTKKVMTAPHPLNLKTSLLQGHDQGLAGDGRILGHL